MPIANKKFAKDKHILYSGMAAFTFGACLLFTDGVASANQNLSSSNSNNVSVSSSYSDSSQTPASSATTSTSQVADVSSGSLATSTSAGNITQSSIVQETSSASSSDTSEALSADSGSSTSNVTSSSSTSVLSSENESGSTSSNVNSTVTTSSGVVDTDNVSESTMVTHLNADATEADLSQAKSAAEEVYQATGQTQVITRVDSSSVNLHDAFLASIKQGAIDGWVKYGILPSVTAAQAILESAWGQSSLSTRAHNLFGIKGSYNGSSISMKTSEWTGSSYTTIYANFRAYPDFSSSILDHGYFLASNSRYSNLIRNRSYTSVANGLHADGYATDPTYASKLISLIQTYGLASWDSEAFALTDKVNAGNLENVSVNGGLLHISGWHVATDSQGKSNEYIIILDASTNKEIARYKVTPTVRTDVKQAYPNVNNSLNSGFGLTIPYTSALAGKNIKIISRYTSSSDGNSNYVDYSFDASLTTNIGNLEVFQVNSNGTVSIGGWHAADASLGKKYHYVIIYDATKGKEVSRILVDTLNRNDVESVYGDVYNANLSGFSTSINYSAAMSGDQIQVISRYSDSSNGEGNYVDIWFAPKVFNANDASLDTFEISGNNLVISGWHAADESIADKYHFIILYDETKNKEIGRMLVSNVRRNDVGVAYGDVYNSDMSGFSITTKLTSAMVGDKISVISRYSDSSTGEGSYVEKWFAPKVFNANNASLDTFEISGNNLVISGWHAADESIADKYHFIILYDETKNKEIGRMLVSNVRRNDVGVAYGDVYNSDMSGFSITTKLTSAMVGDKISVISRYSDSSTGEGSYVEKWFAPKVFNANNASLDTFEISGNNLVISGWHAADESIADKYHFIILYDETKNKEIGRMLVSNVRRNDVGVAYGDVYNSDMSGFSITTELTTAMVGDKISVISRYSDSQSGEGNYVENWFTPKTLNSNDGRFEVVRKTDTGLTIGGWHAADSSLGEKYSFIIIWDATAGKELGRYRVNTTTRNDVAAYLPHTYNSSQSGFSLTIPQLKVPAGHEIQIVSRYSDATNGEGNYIDLWSKKYQI